LAQANIPLLLKLYEYQKQQSKQRYKCSFLGDPALMLAIPKPKIKLTKVNDVLVSQTTDDFKSLARMKVSGEITENDMLLTNYNGEVSTTIFDKTIPRTTLNNDGNSPAINFDTLGETILEVMPLLQTAYLNLVL
jgi:hypothetical protein